MALIEIDNLELGYYDEVLVGISLSLLLGIGAGFLTKLPMAYGAGSGALVAILLMYHGMFRNGPNR